LEGVPACSYFDGEGGLEKEGRREGERRRGEKETMSSGRFGSKEVDEPTQGEGKAAYC